MSDHEDPAPGGRERPPEHAPPRDDGDDDDSMGPPKEPCECWCMHCKRTFMSDRMWFQRVVGDPQGFRGFWMCPTPNCDGAGFTFDIFPTDPDHPANDGWVSFDDDDDEDGEGEWDEGGEFAGEREGDDGAEADWDPNESKWKEMDDALGDPDDDDDIEGDEWKHGLAPGERPPPWAPTFSSDEARREWEAEQRGYDEPDRRPRELDWSDRPDRQPRRDDPTGDQHFREDDIPF